MKKLLLLMCTLLLLGTCCIPTYAQEGYELLDNGDFESLTSFAWFPYYLSSLEYSTDAHSGTYALKVTNRQHYTDVTGQHIAKQLNFYGSGTYQISAYVKLADPEAQPIDLQIAIGYHTPDKMNWATTSFVQVTASDWTLITGQVNLQWAGELTKAEFYIIGREGQEGSDYRDLLIDDCSMTTISYAGEAYAPATTEAPTTEPPTTEEPTTEAPTTEELTTEEPTTQEPTTEEIPTEQPTDAPSEQETAAPDDTEGGKITTKTWFIAGSMYGAGVILLIIGIVLLVTKPKEVVS